MSEPGRGGPNAVADRSQMRDSGSAASGRARLPTGWERQRDVALLVGGMIAGPLFFLTFSVAGAIRPKYDPLRHPVSSLEFGPEGWVQHLNFLGAGTLVSLFALAVRGPIRRLGAALCRSCF